MKKKKIYNWHFWVPQLKVQLVIPDTSYKGALYRAEHLFDYGTVYKRYKIEFQFGELE